MTCFNDLQKYLGLLEELLRRDEIVMGEMPCPTAHCNQLKVLEMYEKEQI